VKTHLHGWYSERAARKEGVEVYRVPGWDASVATEHERKGVRVVTSVVESPARFKDWGDEVYVGIVAKEDFVRKQRL